MKIKWIILLFMVLRMSYVQSLNDISEDDFWDEFNKETKEETREMLDNKLRRIMESPKVRKALEKQFAVDLNEKEIKEIKLIEKWEKKMNFSLRIETINKSLSNKWIGQLHRKFFYTMALEGKDTDMQALRHNSKYSVQRLRRFAFDFDINVQNSGKAQIVGGSIAIVGGIIGAIAAGITLAPFSGGASLAIAVGTSAGMLSAVGAGTGFAGFVISMGGLSGEIAWTFATANKAKSVQELAETEVCESSIIVAMLIDAEQKFSEDIESGKHEKAQSAIAAKMMSKAMSAGLNTKMVVKYLDIWQNNHLLARNFFKISLISKDQIVRYLTDFTTILNDKVAKGEGRSVSYISQSLKHLKPYAEKYSTKILTKLATKRIPVSLMKGTIFSIGRSMLPMFNIGFGIWDVYSGARTIQGLGNIGDTFRAAANELENKVEDLEEAFETITGRKPLKSTVSEDLNIVEIHTCDNTHQSDTNISLIISTTNEKGTETCQTKSIKTKDGKSKWNLNIENLGNCTNFLIYNFSATVSVVNTKNESICIDYLTFATGGKFVPSMNCYNGEIGENVYAKLDISPILSCTRHPTIARIKTHTCSVCDWKDTKKGKCSTPSTKDKIAMDIKFLDKNKKMTRGGSCSTSILNTNNDQFYYGSKDIHRIDTLGTCQSKSFDDFDYKSLETRVFKYGSDDWCTDSLKIYTPGFFKDFNIFKCDVANNGKGTIFNHNLMSNMIQCPLLKAANPKVSIEKMEFHTCSRYYAGTGAVVKMEICDLEKTRCCTTNKLNSGYIKSGTKYTIDGEHYLDDGGENLGDCEGFEIVNNALWFRIDVDSANGMCLTHVNFFGKNSESVPFMKCDFAYNNLWADKNKMRLNSGTYSSRMFRCEDHTYSHITKVSFKLCDVTHSGTDSNIELEIASGKNSCTTRVLRSARNDFERGDYNEFLMTNKEDCGNMEIEDRKVAVKVVNTGSDALCLSQTMIFITDGKGHSHMLDCRLDQKGLEQMSGNLCSSSIGSSELWTRNCYNSTGSYIPLMCV